MMQLSCTISNLLLYDELGINNNIIIRISFIIITFIRKECYWIVLEPVKFMIVKYKIVV